MMIEGAQGYEETDPPQTILKSAEANAAGYTRDSKKSPAISLMNVVLAANRNYELQVRPHIDDVRKNYPGLTIEKLAELLRTEFTTALKLKAMWGHNDEKKFNILTALVKKIRAMDTASDTVKSDFEVMKSWAHSSNVQNWEENSLSQIHGVGIATFQHLRMTFGVNTVKPDKRVKEVLQREFSDFNLSTTNKNAISAVEEIADITKYSVLQIDQIFVKYGSGYYQKVAKKQA